MPHHRRALHADHAGSARRLPPVEALLEQTGPVLPGMAQLWRDILRPADWPFIR